MQEQGDWTCPKHPDKLLEWDGRSFVCVACILTRKIEKVWESFEPLSLAGLIASVDESIMEFLWLERDGTLVNLFLYFNSETKPLDRREFLEFWGSLSEAEEDYYMSASAEGLQSEAKGYSK